MPFAHKFLDNNNNIIMFKVYIKILYNYNILTKPNYRKLFDIYIVIYIKLYYKIWYVYNGAFVAGGSEKQV